MSGVTLAQAVRNAVDTELAAERFYQQLASNTRDAQARVFLTSMASDEREHAAALERFGQTLLEKLPERAEEFVRSVETAPGWGGHQGITLQEALHVAIEAENHAALYYDALADSVVGEPAAFFRTLAATEEDHAARLAGTLAQLPR